MSYKSLFKEGKKEGRDGLVLEVRPLKGEMKFKGG